MKFSLKMLSGLTLISLSLTGCDLFDKVDDVTFEGVLPVEFVINETATSAVPVTYGSTETLNALDDAEIDKYRNKIKEIKLTAITYEIKNYTAPGEVTFSDGSLKVGPSEKLLAAVASVALSDTPETELTSLDLDGVNEFAKELDGDKEVQISMQGVLSTTPVAFTLVAKFHVTVTAEVLN